MAKRKKPVKKTSPRVTGAPATSQTSAPPLGTDSAAGALPVVELSKDQPAEIAAPAAVDPALSDALKAVQALSPTQLINETDLWVSKGHLQLADNIYTTWLAGGHTSMRHVILFNHGALLQQLKQLDRALASYREAIQLAPLFGQAYVNLGLLLEKAQLNDQALAIWGSFVERARQAERVDVEMVCTALNHIGRLNENIKRYEAAESALEKSLALNPKQPGVIQHWIHIRQKSCNWPIFTDLGSPSLVDLLRYTSPLATLALSDDPERQYQSARSFVTRTYRPHTPSFPLHAVDPTGKWRIGIVSGDLKEHAVGFLIPAFLDGLDRDQYSLTAYDFSGDDQSDLQKRIHTLLDHRIDVSALTDEACAKRINEDKIDILIDLQGLSKGARPEIFSYRPAPIQITYLGYIGTTALDYFDYQIIDKVALTNEFQEFMSEKPLYVEGSFIPLPSPSENVSNTISRSDAGLANDAFVMASFGNVYKITPEMFATWMSLLQKIENSVLWLIDDNPITTHNLKAHAASVGIEGDRIVFMPRCTPSEYRAKLRLADVFLDTFPYNCGSTATDVINADIPLISRFGKAPVSRMGLSLLTEVGQGQLAVDSFEKYNQLVIELATSPDKDAYHYDRGVSTNKLPAVLNQLREQLKNNTATTERALQVDQHTSQSNPSTHQIQAQETEFFLANLAAQFGQQEGSTQSSQSDIYKTKYSKNTKSEIFTICWSDETISTALARGEQVLDNRANTRPDWFEYWPIRTYLMNTELDEDKFYAFLSPKFSLKTGRTHKDFGDEIDDNFDVIFVSPQPDQAAAFLNVFEHGEFYYPGFKKMAGLLLARTGLSGDILDKPMDSRTIVFSNYFAAKPKFWREWFTITELIFNAAENHSDSMHELLNTKSNYPGAVEYKVFLQEIVASIILSNSGFIAKGLNPWKSAWSQTPFAKFKNEMVISDALKIAAKQTSHPEYMAAFATIRDQIIRQIRN